MNSSTRACETCGKPATIIDNDNTALCSEHALQRFKRGRPMFAPFTRGHKSRMH